MVEWLCLKCFSCEMFQVKQRTKAKKWNCTVCGSKQSFKKIYAVSNSAASIRPIVQQYNMERSGKEQAKLKSLEYIESYEQDAVDKDDDDDATSHLVIPKPKQSLWPARDPEAPELDEENDDESELQHADFLWGHGPKRSRVNKKGARASRIKSGDQRTSFKHTSGSKATALASQSGSQTWKQRGHSSLRNHSGQQPGKLKRRSDEITSSISSVNRRNVPTSSANSALNSKPAITLTMSQEIMPPPPARHVQHVTEAENQRPRKQVRKNVPLAFSKVPSMKSEQPTVNNHAADKPKTSWSMLLPLTTAHSPALPVLDEISDDDDDDDYVAPVAPKKKSMWDAFR